MKTSMKKSRKYILRTLFASYALIFLFVGINRATESSDFLPRNETVRTSPDVLESFSGFTSVQARGDFNLQVDQGNNFSIEYLPPSASNGNFDASMAGETLIIDGFGNRQNGAQNRTIGQVIITLPQLIALSTSFNPEVQINGFNQEGLQIELSNIGTASLTSNTISLLDMEANFVRELILDENNITTEQLSINGNTVISR